MTNSKTKKEFKIPLAIIDVFAFAFVALMVGFLLIGFLSYNSHQSDSLMLGLFLPFFVILFTGFGFYIYLEYKYNRLKINTVFFYLMIVVAIANVIAVSCLPSQISLPYGASMTITTIMRVYFLMTGCAAGVIPYLWFYLVPRKVLHRHYMDIVLYIILGIVVIFIILSFITEWDKYIHIFTYGIVIDDRYALSSVSGHKAAFSSYLLMGIFASILLRIRQKKWQWNLLIIPLFIFLCLTLTKLTILLVTVLLITYSIVQIVLLCKKSRNNLIITLLVVGFFVLLSPMFIVGMVRSESGLLFEIKNLFADVFQRAKETFDSRRVIWDCAFKLLLPHQYIFGVGTNTFGLALRYTYAQVAQEATEKFFLAHNIFIEWIGQGGIILLGIYVFLHLYLIKTAFKMRKQSYWLSIASISMISMYVLNGMITSNSIFSPGSNFMMGTVLVLPVMSEYYIFKDKDEKDLRKDIVTNTTVIKTDKCKSKLLTLNKRRLIFDAKWIACDLNNKIKV